MVYAWGYNEKGQLGDGTNTTRSTPVKVTNISEIVDISASETDQVLALKADGTVWGWGYNSLGALTDVGGSIPKQILGIDGNRMNNISAIYAGDYAGLAITNEEKVLAWGTNGYGELGNGTTTNNSVPAYVMENTDTELNNVFISAIGKNYSVYGKTDGTVWATGYNAYGQLGNTSTVTINMPENISSDYISTDALELTFNNENETKPINAKYNSGFNLYNYENSKDLTYSSQDENIATVDNAGNVTSKGTGKTYINITAGDLTRRIEVNVLKQDEVAVMDAKAGGRHTIGLKTNGTLWAFGDNSYGQLGLGEISNTTYAEPQEVTAIPDGMKFTKIAVGRNHSLALGTDGNVYSFGLNANGQLGDGTTSNSGKLIKVEGLSDIVKISAYENMSMAIDKDGNLYTWGEGYSKTPTKIEFYSKVIDMSGKFLLSEYGTVWDMKNIYQKVAGLTNVVEIASGDSHNLALKSDGTVYAWGNNTYGQLGTGNVQNSDTPTLIKDVPEIESVKAGKYNSYLLSTDGEIYSFGGNSNNSLGLNTTDNYIAVPTKVESSRVQRISAGQNYALYVRDDGYVYSWGQNTYGQLGHFDRQEKAVPTLIGSARIIKQEDYVTIKEGESHPINVTLNNTFNLRQDIIDNSGFTYTPINSDIATTKGNNIVGVTSGITTIVVEHTASKEQSVIFVEVLKDETKSVIDIKASKDFNIALKADGSVWSFGLNSYGQLALKDNKNYNEPQKIDLDTRAKQIAVGTAHTVILTEEGKVLTSGLNTSGQLGNGTVSNANTLVNVLNEYGKEIENIAMVSSHNNTTYLLDYDGNVYACGKGYKKVAVKLEGLKNIAQISGKYGISAENKVIDLSTKQAIEGLKDIIKISQGENHAIFLSKDKIAYAIGTNTNGQCGNGTKVNCMTPTIIKDNVGTGILSNIKDISAGNNFSMAVLENGEVYTWGSNENNKLGTEQTTDQVLPKKNSNTSNGIIVSAGTNHAVYVKEEGNVYAWGNGKKGSLGNRVNANSVEPVLVGSQEVVVNTNHVTIEKH